MIYKTRRADYLEEALTIVCKHEMQDVQTDNGPCRRCSKCSIVFSEEWYPPQTVVAEATPA